MTHHIFKEIQQLLQSLRIISQSTFIFNKKVYDFADSKYPKTTITQLTNLLYRVYHCRNNSNPFEVYNWNDYSRIQDFTAELSLSNLGTGTWEGGWKILRIEDDGRIAVRKNGLTLWISSKHFKPNSHMLNAGQMGTIRMVKEYRRLSPGFYMINGNAPQLTEFDNDVIRIYWNIALNHARILSKNYFFRTK